MDGRSGDMGVHGAGGACKVWWAWPGRSHHSGALERLGYACRDNGLIFSINAHMWAVCAPLVAFGTEEQKIRYLPGLSSGDLIGANAVSEPWVRMPMACAARRRNEATVTFLTAARRLYQTVRLPTS